MEEALHVILGWGISLPWIFLGEGCVETVDEAGRFPDVVAFITAFNKEHAGQRGSSKEIS